jgi:hypothetical protein
MPRILKIASLPLGIALLLQLVLGSELQALPIVESKFFAEGPYSFKMEVQVSGGGHYKKKPLQLSSLKLKIKNDRTSSVNLAVKAIRAYSDPVVFKDIETRGFSVAPGRWVTKFYRLPKERQISIGEQGYIEISFENFIIRFSPKERKFQGPIR